MKTCYFVIQKAPRRPTFCKMDCQLSCLPSLLETFFQNLCFLGLRLLVSVRWCPAVALKPHCRHGGLFWMSARAAGCNGATSLHMFCTCSAIHSSAVSITVSLFSKMCRASGAIDLPRGGAVRLRPAGLGIRPLSRLSWRVRPQTSQAVMIGRGQRWTKRGHRYGMWQ